MNSQDYPLVVSFYTSDWEYPQHAERLKIECDALGLDNYIVHKKSRGNYTDNTCIKASFIRECLKFGRPILWVDVDGSICKLPDYFLDTAFDLQARRMDKATRTREWHVGTLWMAPTAVTEAFVDAWCDRVGDMTDESAFDQAWKSKLWDMKARNIPPEYFVILRRGAEPDEGDVIAHRLSNGRSKREQKREFERYEREVG